MVVNISLPKQQNRHLPSIFSIKKYCYLHAKQLTYHEPIYYVRIVYHDERLEKHHELVEYANNKRPFSQQNLAYLKSESWMEDFPHFFEVKEFRLAELPNYFCYVCVTGYKNNRAEYIQVISTEPLCEKQQEHLGTSAQILSQYVEMYSENVHQKSKIQLLEHIIHKAGHQIRNSLSSISIYAQNLFLRLSDNDYREQAKIIDENVQRLDFNLTEILSCGQGVKLNIASQSLKEIVAESIKNFQPIIYQKQIEIDVSKISTMVPLDKIQIQQVFDNLISNAIHFSPKFGKIGISWQSFQGEILITICDEGPGISSEDMQKIFNPFYSRRDGGTGLGLTIAKKIILDHSGNLWVENSPFGGAVFSIILPKK